ncbi:heme oxygenase-like domain-containing protein [Acidimangrovimonas sediminis]|uniref:hypothetical protein n=1 Tax=Acidimangrovimonas sediminis TaxID=2056283 RepID=UPI000C7FFFDB|nr:hypothetical protein [Acidimangrovimonas sediminis]
MTTRSHTGFRARLRDGTRSVHDAVEAVFQPFHDDPAAEMGPFLRAQWLALEALARAAAGTQTPEEEAVLAALLAALSEDGAAGRPLGPVPALDPLAVAYVVFGSRLGTLVLTRRATDAGVAPLPAYFDPRDTRQAWQAICARLDEIGPEDPRARQVETDVTVAFSCFLAAARLVREERAGTASQLPRTGETLPDLAPGRGPEQERPEGGFPEDRMNMNA